MADRDSSTSPPATSQPYGATFIELRAHICRARHAAQHCTEHAPDPESHAFDGVLFHLEQITRILGEVAEARTVAAAQRDLDVLQALAAKRGES